jgi:hypothetical protein
MPDGASGAVADYDADGISDIIGSQNAVPGIFMSAWAQ